MILYQQFNSLFSGNNDIRIYDSFEYMAHLHRDFEFVYVLEGTLTVFVENMRYELTPGKMLLVLSNQIHSYQSNTPNRAVIHVFSGDNVPAFTRLVSGKASPCPVFTCDEEIARYYLQYCLEKGNRSPFAFKSYLYGICDCFLQKCELCDAEEISASILHRMLTYISEHFQEDITLKNMAAELGYESHYLSRVFGKAIGIHMKQYINLYRIDRAKDLLINTEDSITDIALSCGFQSIRNFDRVFMASTNMTPQEFRRKGL